MPILIMTISTLDRYYACSVSTESLTERTVQEKDEVGVAIHHILMCETMQLRVSIVMYCYVRFEAVSQFWKFAP